MEDGGTGQPAGKFWKQSLAQIVGAPPQISFAHVGDPDIPAPTSVGEIKANRSLWTGPLGPYYSSGLSRGRQGAVRHPAERLALGRQRIFRWAGRDRLLDRSRANRTSAAKPFPAPLGNLSWVQRGRGGNYVDGYVYAIATEREFNATNLIMGAACRTSPTSPTRPKWQWMSGWQQQNGVAYPTYSGSPSAAVPIASWLGHITYPQMSYDAPLHHYLLTSRSPTARGHPRSGAGAQSSTSSLRRTRRGRLFRGTRDELRTLQRI